MNIIKEEKKSISKIVDTIKGGGVVAVATDTVYGLVCDAGNNEAVEKIFIIKGRDKTKPLPVFVKDINMAKKFAEINQVQEKFLKEKWPGNTTTILKVRLSYDNLNNLSTLVYKNETIGIRIPNYEFLNNLLKKINKPLAQTSANVSGQLATTKIKEVISQFDLKSVRPDIIVDAGDLPDSKPSTIIDLTDNNKIIRK